MKRFATRTKGIKRHNVKGLSWTFGQWLDQPVHTAAYLLILLLVLLLGIRNTLGPEFIEWIEIGQGAFVEATGAMMDLILFGLYIAAVTDRRTRKREIQGHEDLIEDFKRWDSKEARHRIGGAIRRLNNLGRTAIDFSGIKLTHFSLSERGIISIANSTFHNQTLASWGKGSTILTDVNFMSIDCCEVVFSEHDVIPSEHTKVIDCCFQGCRLTGANFSGALLEWTEPPPKEIGHWEEVDSSSYFVQTYYPPFHEVDLAGVSFERAVFRNADFRDAHNLENCNFSGAKGLDDCLFDNEHIRTKVLKKVGEE